MRATAVQTPPWPLGIKFIDANGRKFEVIQTIYGDSESPVCFMIEFENGWSTISQGDDYEQTMVGFVQQGSKKLVVQSIAAMNEFLQNGHLKLL
ncbi:MAG: hypothetical protein ACTJHT_15435 [Sphingobacterium sp.]